MTLNVPRPDLALVALCGLALVGVVVCALLGVDPPPVLEFVAMTALGGGAGIAVQKGAPTTAPEDLPSPAGARAGSAADLPAPGPTPPPPPPYDPTATGVMRVVSHAP